MRTQYVAVHDLLRPIRRFWRNGRLLVKHDDELFMEAASRAYSRVVKMFDMQDATDAYKRRR